ncbi:MAG: TIGR00266 family protein [Candidatus Marsarchaeota archaeon]
MPTFQVEGADLQYVTVSLGPGEAVYGDAGHLLSKSSTVGMQTVMMGGLLGALKREVTGGSFFVTQINGPGQVSFAGVFPGKIVELDLAGTGVLAESHSFLVAEEGVKYDATMARLAPGLLGGEGLFLAKFSGNGKLFLHAYGALQRVDLKAGEKIQVEAAHLLALDASMSYSVTRVGGLKSMLFAGEGFFFVEVEGPGQVLIHSITAQQLASALAGYLPNNAQAGAGIRLRY